MTSATLTQPHEDTGSKVVFGFWLYLMSDCILFAILFAVFAVLHKNTFGGPGAGDLASLQFILTETLLLLASSFTCGLAMLARYHGHKNLLLLFLAITFALGVGFLGMELKEFIHLVHEGNSWQRSGFLSAFYTLVGTHGLHVFIGLIWMVVMMVQVSIRGITADVSTRLTCLALFWHFLDIVWIFVFSIVYLVGAI